MRFRNLALLCGLSAVLFCMASQPVIAGKETLMKPEEMTETAPDQFKVKFETSKGDFVLEVTRKWSPNGVDRFYNLVKNDFFTDVRFFRVIKGFMAQFGIHGDPEIAAVWRDQSIPDDPVQVGNKRGYITFAKTGQPNSRGTQFFINFKDNLGLDRQGFAPFGKVVEGMQVVDSVYSGYGEGAPRGLGPSQELLQTQGNAYLAKDFSEMDYIKKATIMGAKAEKTEKTEKAEPAATD
jgi:peptidyl-prolyl cis-trans isomerase A (cyclophilin A)